MRLYLIVASHSRRDSHNIRVVTREFKMLWVHTKLHTAAMVDLLIGRNLATMKFIGKAVC